MLWVVDQLPDLEKLLFCNFGEPLLHSDVVPFLREVRRRWPGVTVHTSTNGLALSAETVATIAGEVLADRVVFSIDGASEQAYRRYRRGGSFERAHGAVETFARECERAGTRDRVDVVWQYILFDWNDSDDEIARARVLAAEAVARGSQPRLAGAGDRRALSSLSRWASATKGGFSGATAPRRSGSAFD